MSNSLIVEKNIKFDKNKKEFKVTAEYYHNTSRMIEDLKSRDYSCRDFKKMEEAREITKNWHGVSSYKEAMDLLDNGWSEKIGEVKETLSKENLMGNGKRVTFTNDIVGYSPIVPLAIRGVPKNMINSDMKKIKCKVVDVYYDNTFSASTPTEEILRIGLNVVAAILKLEMEGYKINLYAVQTYTDNDSADMLCVKIKDSRQLMDLKRIMFPLMHPAFFRVIGFDWYSKMPKAKYRSGYGRNLNISLGNNEASTEEYARKVIGGNTCWLCGSKILGKGVEVIKEDIQNAGKNSKVVKNK